MQCVHIVITDKSVVLHFMLLLACFASLHSSTPFIRPHIHIPPLTFTWVLDASCKGALQAKKQVFIHRLLIHLLAHSLIQVG